MSRKGLIQLTNFFISDNLNEFITKRQKLVEILTPRELDVLQLLTKGMTNREIAESLHLTPGTIRIYLSNIYLKLDVSSRTQAAIMAKDLGI